MIKKPSKERSRIMRAVKSKNTAPEIAVRRLIHGMGYRYRLHRKDFPGKPDLLFPGKKKVVFVHGCFWHGHDCKRGAREPKTNVDYWRQKISRNRNRDVEHKTKLKEMGWNVLVIWECETKQPEDLPKKVKSFLDS